MIADVSLVTVLRKVATATAAIAPLLPPPASIVAGIVSAGLALGADLVAAGEDPIAAIHRIRDVHPALQAIDARWSDRVRKRYGELVALQALAPEGSDAEDIYAAFDLEVRT